MERYDRMLKVAKEWFQNTITGDVRLLRGEVINRLCYVTERANTTVSRLLTVIVCNEEPDCRYWTFMDDDENVWIELKPDYRKTAP